jgi:hypothetical protein
VPLTQTIEPFIVEAKVLRAGMNIEPPRNPRARDPKTSNEAAHSVSVLRAVEIVAMLASTAAIVPLIATGIVFGFLYLLALFGLFFLLLAAGALVGLYGVWSLLLRSDRSLAANKRLRGELVRFVQIGIFTSFAISPWIFTPLLRGLAIVPREVLCVSCLWMAPLVVGVHRVWRLHRMMRALGVYEESRAMLLVRRCVFAVGVALERLGTSPHPGRQAKWGARW